MRLHLHLHLQLNRSVSFPGVGIFEIWTESCLVCRRYNKCNNVEATQIFEFDCARLEKYKARGEKGLFPS